MEQNKILHMIGNSHIDPVWFWPWEEGMQEVKSTFASALARMKEYPDFKFSATSSVFFEWVQRVSPAMFAEIQQRVQEGRFEICSGWFLEPDCNLPRGESFVRHALYAQRFYKQNFGFTCNTCSNVDSFGHSATLPQLVAKAGMQHYVFMRPRTTDPVFTWQGTDGTQVCAISLPAEYTTWFHEPTVKNITQTLERTPEHPHMVCCYGVGNHGGGPTIENIESIRSLQNSFENTTLVFSTFQEFFATLTAQLPLHQGGFEKINEGCYSIDSLFKKEHRLAEQRLLQADAMLSMVRLCTGAFPQEAEQMEKLWKLVLFNQFHDTLGGTAVKEARDEGLRQLAHASSAAHAIKVLAMQDIANHHNTEGEGYPLWVFNPNPTAFEGIAEAEVEWFCQAPMAVCGPNGEELAYQRVHTDAKVRHTTLGGRRRFLFKACVPAYGFSVYRLHKKSAACFYDARMQQAPQTAYAMENQFTRVEFNPQTGMLCSLVEKATNYNALHKDAEFQLWIDQRDAWGGLQDRTYADSTQRFAMVSLEKTEDGPLRQTIRAVYTLQGATITQHFHLYNEEAGVVIDTHVFWNKPWHMLKYCLPTGCNQVRSEAAYGEIQRTISDGHDYFMHGWADVFAAGTGGLCIANNAKYAFSCPEGDFTLSCLRSAIYAQGNSVNWQNQQETYHYTDMGEDTFRMVLIPHKNPLAALQAQKAAARAAAPYDILADNCHPGACTAAETQYITCPEGPVVAALAKKAEDSTDVILRLFNTSAHAEQTHLQMGALSIPVAMKAHELRTLRICPETGRFTDVNLLEWQE